MDVQADIEPNDYFAFMESRDPHAREVPEQALADPQTPWDELLQHRGKAGFDTPTEVIWLDCVRADYFLGLDWLDEACEIGNPAHGIRRRRRLRGLDRTEFRAALVPIDEISHTEYEQLSLYAELPWHLVTFDAAGVLPTMTAPDFDLDVAARELTRVSHKRFASNDEHRFLQNVFNLNFLPDAGFGRREYPDGEPQPSDWKPGASRPGPATGLAKRKRKNSRAHRGTKPKYR